MENERVARVSGQGTALPRIWIRNAKLVMATGIIEGSVVVQGKKIEKIIRGSGIEADINEVMDAKGLYLSPGFIDVHTHGAGGSDFMDGTLSAIYNACRTHLLHGTTSIVPTTLTGSKESLLSVVRLFNQTEPEKDGCPEIIGLHLEGPYFSPQQRGAENPKYLRNPEPEEYRKIFANTKRICRWSFAVELPGSGEFLRELREQGIISSLAHSDADCRQVFEAYENGLSALTHFYSCMSGVTRKNAYRTAGAIEAGYLLDDLYVEVIADGCHLPAELLSLIYKGKGAERICLVTDSMRAAGMPDGEFILGKVSEGIVCVKEDGVAKLPDRSAFAGSVATMDQLVRNFRSLTGAPLYQVVKMASLTPARFLHIEDRKGSICEGKDADLLLFDEDIHLKKIMLRGKWFRE